MRAADPLTGPVGRPARRAAARRALPLLALTLAVVLALPATRADAASEPQYRVVQQVPLPGDEGWDYLAFDPQNKWLLISHGTRVLVLDADKLTVMGEIANTPGVHGIALAAQLNRGYISAGRSDTIVMFNLQTLARLSEIKVTGEVPDAILYDSASQRVFTFNGRGRNATAVDARAGSVVGTIPLDAKPEFAASDGRGHVYVNLQDRNSIAAIDPRQLKVSSVWPVPGCEGPSGLAIDPGARRLFTVCSNRVMVVVDAASGRALGSAPIGGGVDAVVFDPGTHMAFASCGEGVLTVLRIGASGAPEPVQTVPTERGARTLALDAARHRIFLVTASFGPPPAATPEQPYPRPAILPDTFRLLVVSP